MNIDSIWSHIFPQCRKISHWIIKARICGGKRVGRGYAFAQWIVVGKWFYRHFGVCAGALILNWFSQNPSILYYNIVITVNVLVVLSGACIISGFVSLRVSACYCKNMIRMIVVYKFDFYSYCIWCHVVLDFTMVICLEPIREVLFVETGNTIFGG